MYCSFLVGYDTFWCCSSCHDDEELGYDAGVTLEVQGRDYYVCCIAQAWAKKQPQDTLRVEVA